MIDYKETRDIVSIEENRQLQTGTSAEVLSATRKNHFYKIKFKKKTQKKYNTNAFILKKIIIRKEKSGNR